MSLQEAVCVSHLTADTQAGPQQVDHSHPIFLPLVINPTYSALPVSLHCKLTFYFFSLPLLLSFSVFYLLLPLSFVHPYPHPCSKFIHVKIIDDEEYEKNKNFFLELAEPRMVDMSLQKGAVLKLFLSFLTFVSVIYSHIFIAWFQSLYFFISTLPCMFLLSP